MSTAESSCTKRSSSIFCSSSAIGCSKSRKVCFIGAVRRRAMAAHHSAAAGRRRRSAPGRRRARRRGPRQARERLVGEHGEQHDRAARRALARPGPRPSAPRPRPGRGSARAARAGRARSPTACCDAAVASRQPAPSCTQPISARMPRSRRVAANGGASASADDERRQTPAIITCGSMSTVAWNLRSSVTCAAKHTDTPSASRLPARRPASSESREHDDDAGERDDHRDPGARGTGSCSRKPAAERREERRHAHQHERVGDRRARERADEEEERAGEERARQQAGPADGAHGARHARPCITSSTPATNAAMNSERQNTISHASVIDSWRTRMPPDDQQTAATIMNRMARRCERRGTWQDDGAGQRATQRQPARRRDCSRRARPRPRGDRARHGNSAAAKSRPMAAAMRREILRRHAQEAEAERGAPVRLAADERERVDQRLDRRLRRGEESTRAAERREPSLRRRAWKIGPSRDAADGGERLQRRAIRVRRCAANRTRSRRPARMRSSGPALP